MASTLSNCLGHEITENEDAGSELGVTASGTKIRWRRRKKQMEMKTDAEPRSVEEYYK